MKKLLTGEKNRTKKNTTEKMITPMPMGRKQKKWMKEYVTMPGVVYADKVIVQSENIKKLYVKKLTEFLGEDLQKEWDNKITY